jgi:hypothetical protein
MITRTKAQLLPTVTWGGNRITRMILGHNPLKGGSHFSEELSAQMREWHAEMENRLALLRRCEECGINTVQCGGEDMHRLISEHRRRGGNLNWIASLYCNETGSLGFGSKVSWEEELQGILSVTPRPIGIQHFGECTDRLYFEKRLPEVKERMKRLRDTGLLIGVCTHLPEVAEEVAAEGWDIDFYQLSVYTAYAGTRRQGIDRTHEIFEDVDRDRMLNVIRKIDKPCVVFKVLGANRKCSTDAEVERAIKHVFANIKARDVVCVGMWQKHKDQVEQNTSFVRKILETGRRHEPQT